MEIIKRTGKSNKRPIKEQIKSKPLLTSMSFTLTIYVMTKFAVKNNLESKQKLLSSDTKSKLLICGI